MFDVLFNERHPMDWEQHWHLFREASARTAYLSVVLYALTGAAALLLAALGNALGGLIEDAWRRRHR